MKGKNMIETKTVNVSSIIPDPHNPRTDFGDIEALAASFGANTSRPGEPFIPLLLVKDGKKYRIIDGERRYRAMELLGTKKCLANVAEEMDDANTLLAMLATDDKLPLTPLEQSCGFQLALLFGIDADMAAKALRIESDQAVKAKRAVEHIDAEKAQTMTLDRLYALAEFSDEKAITAVTNAKEDKWKEVYEKEQRRVRYVEFEASARVAAKKFALPFDVQKDPPYSNHAQGSVTVQDLSLWKWEKEGDEIFTQAFSGEHIVSVVLKSGNTKNCWSTPSVRVYRAFTEEELSREQQKTAEQIETANILHEHEMAFCTSLDRPKIYLSENIGDMKKMSALSRAAYDFLQNGGFGYSFKETLADLGIEKLPYLDNPYYVIKAAEILLDDDILEFTYRKHDYKIQHAHKYLSLLQALVDTGYELSDPEVAFQTDCLQRISAIEAEEVAEESECAA
jgi:ParB-like chromosome segregation protein Spo0J